MKFKVQCCFQFRSQCAAWQFTGEGVSVKFLVGEVIIGETEKQNNTKQKP